MPLADDATTGQNMAIHTKDKDSSEQLKQLCCVFLNKQTEPPQYVQKFLGADHTSYINHYLWFSLLSLSKQYNNVDKHIGIHTYILTYIVMYGCIDGLPTICAGSQD